MPCRSPFYSFILLYRTFGQLKTSHIKTVRIIRLYKDKQTKKVDGMEERLFSALIKCFFISFGVLTGGALFGSISAYLTGDPPITELINSARKLRIWAVVAAIGGTFDAISTFEKGIFDASTPDLVKQIMLIIAAMGGVKAGLLLIELVTQGEV